MKRILAMIMAVAIIGASTAGCTNRDGNSSSSGTSSSSSSSSSSSMPSSEPDGPAEDPNMPRDDQVPSAPTMGTDFEKVSTLSSESITWGPGTSQTEEGRSADCEVLQDMYGDYNAYFIAPSDEKKIYLTFDEGYENGYTEKILDILKEKNVPAVFFVTGHYVNNNKEIVQRIVDEGHMLGNHSYGHLDYPTLSPQEAYDDIKKLHDLIEEEFGYTMRLFRFPEGKFSEQNLAMLTDAGYQASFWSFAYNDWSKYPEQQPKPDVAYERLTKWIAPGAIYLLHAVSSTNADILDDFIDEARARGYEFSEYNLPNISVQNP